MIASLVACLLGFLLDLFLGDPFPWHPVMAIGRLIQALEKGLRRVFPSSASGEWMAGTILFFLTAGISCGCLAGLLFLCYRISPILGFTFEVIMCYVLLATRSLKTESMKVYHALAQGDVEAARRAVSMIVGRDTAQLSEEGMIKAAVETVAENTADGSLAPMFYMILFGPIGGLFYKTVNTMDSMIGYKNEAYQYFGKTAARMDDLLNFIPARITACFMLAAVFMLRLPVKNAIRIYLRDRSKHKSPNAAQTESVMAGALEISLAGSSWYFGKKVDKPTIGDAVRVVVKEDIIRANQILYLTAGIGFFVLFLIKLLLITHSIII